MMKRHGTVAIFASLWAFGRAAALALPAAALLAPGIAHAQFSDGYNFLKAVRDRDGDKAMSMIQKPGSTLIDSRDPKTGETALHIVVARRDMTWLGFLLGKGAKPDLADNAGNTPLMVATQLRFTDAARLLLAAGAVIDKVNDNGETALIRAVQLRDVTMARFLIANGANADKRDQIAGMSARDYAIRDGRTPGLVEALSTAKAAKPATTAPVQGPTF